jgi:hypothetical protein
MCQEHTVCPLVEKISYAQTVYIVLPIIKKVIESATAPIVGWPTDYRIQSQTIRSDESSDQARNPVTQSAVCQDVNLVMHPAAL